MSPTVIPYDVSDVEVGGGGTTEPKPKVYVGQIMKVDLRTEKNDGTPISDLKVTVNLGGDYVWLTEYVGLGDNTAWKKAEFIRALGLPNKGKLNIDKINKDKPLVRVKVNPDSMTVDDGEGGTTTVYRARVGRFMRAQAGDELEESTNGGGAVEQPDEPEADEPETAEAEAVGDDSFVPSRESDPEIGSYDQWDDGDLEAEVTDRDLTLPGGRGKKRDKFITALRADDAESEGDGNDDAGDGNSTEDDYDGWDADQLKQEWEDRNLGDLPNIRGRGAADRLKEHIIEALRQDDIDNPFEG